MTATNIVKKDDFGRRVDCARERNASLLATTGRVLDQYTYDELFVQAGLPERQSFLAHFCPIAGIEQRQVSFKSALVQDCSDHEFLRGRAREIF